MGVSVEHFEPNDPNIPAILDPDGLDCILAAGDAGDIGQLQDWLDSLSRDAYGHVFLEVFAPMQEVPIRAPRAVGITWLYRESRCRSPRPGIGIPRGQTLACAVDAWLDEWLRPIDDERHICVWAGARTSSVMNRYWRKLSQEMADRITH